METVSSSESSAADSQYDRPSSSSHGDPPSLTLPSNLPLQPADADGRKQRRSSCRPTFVVPVACNIDDDDDCAFQGDEADGRRRANGDLPARRRHSVSFLPCRGTGSTTSSGGGEDFDEDFSPEHRRLQRTPTPYYEEAPSLMAATETLNVDDMDAAESLDDSMTDASGTTEGSIAQKAARFSYDGDDDDDDDEEDICRELAQLN